MPDQVRGEAALIEANLPAAVNIASTTNASPVVVTTSTAHGIVTGDYLRIAGASQAALNGDWLAGATASSTQVQLLTIPDGSNSAAPGGTGGAAGTLQSLGFGEDNSYSIPVDITDARDAASVNVALLNLGGRTSYMLYKLRTLAEVFASVFDQELTPGTEGYDGPFTATTYTDSSVHLATVPECLAGDVLQIDFNSTGSYFDDSHPTHDARIRIVAVEDFGGANTLRTLEGAQVVLRGTQITPIGITSQRTIVTPGDAKVKIQAKLPSNVGAESLLFAFAGTLRVTRFRKVG